MEATNTNTEGLEILREPLNDRLYLVDSTPESRDEELPSKLIEMAKEKGKGKVLVRIPFPARKPFLNGGYVQEARVRGMFGREDGLLLSHFLDESRNRSLRDDEMAILHEGIKTPSSPSKAGTPLELLTEEDAEAIASLADSQAAYPVSDWNADEVKEMMAEGTRFLGIRDGDALIAYLAVRPKTRGRLADLLGVASLAERLDRDQLRAALADMHAKMKAEGQRNIFTIVRARAGEVNLALSAEGYHYVGSLRGDTRFGDDLENMNVWQRRL